LEVTARSPVKVLVTGTQGQLACSLAERSAAFPGLDVFLVGRAQLDLERPQTIEPALEAAAPDVVINAAAYTAVDQAEAEPEKAHIVNADAAGALAAAMRRRGGRYIQISTDYVFDGRSAEPYGEESPVAPLGVYGRSKLAGEEAVRRELPEAAIVRTAWVYSPFGSNFVRTMVKLAAERDVVAVVQDQRGSPTSALDLASGLLTMIDAWASGSAAGLGRTYHLAGRPAASWHDVAARVFEVLEEMGLKSPVLRAIRTDEWPTKATRPANSVLDSARFARDFGYAIPDWRSSVAETVRRLASTP
jgi:dTDP-4-dehydrorhamnose reductase